MSTEDDLRIDEHNLEKEWVRQPLLYYEYAMQLAEARRKSDEAKAELEVLKAELDSDIREFPDSYDVKKVTETAVAKAIIANEGYQKQQKRVNKTTSLVRELEAVQWALEHRKQALKCLVELHLANYFSEPSKSSMKESAIEMMRERNKREVRSRARRRREKDE